MMPVARMWRDAESKQSFFEQKGERLSRGGGESARRTSGSGGNRRAGFALGQVAEAGFAGALLEGGAAGFVKEGRPSFLKKRSKKLLTPLSPIVSAAARIRNITHAEEASVVKVFCFFFSKKKAFLMLPVATILLP